MDGMSDPRTIAYFSMEIALDPAMPTYSGGLGVLAGDSLRAAADLGIPMVAVTLLHHKGYFRQRLDAQGHQSESPALWHPEEFLERLDERVTVSIAGRAVHVGAWRYTVRGTAGHTVPVYLLDTRLPENTAGDQALTDELYGGDSQYRLCQEMVLGIGGVAMLRALGYAEIRTYHMNEGHSGLLTLALLEEQLNGRAPGSVTPADIEWVRQRCVFTVHTPVAAGHDTFPGSLVTGLLGPERLPLLEQAPAQTDGVFNLTAFAMFFCRSINGVSLRHGQVSHEMFPQYNIGAVTNGVHADTWISPWLGRLFDARIPAWRRDRRYLRYAVRIPIAEIREAHAQAKLALLTEVERRTGVQMDPAALTIGFARRATGYKRADLLFTDIARLKRIARRVGPLQAVFAGKAHPQDSSGKSIIEHVFGAAKALSGVMKVVYLEDYDMAVARLLCAGVDLWLNNPQQPLEASGTSGMKAAMNGVPSLSVLDGWWVEGHIEGVTGWAIGGEEPAPEPAEAQSLYDKLEYVIMPLFYRQPAAYGAVMRYAIAINGDFFSAERMMAQYLRNVYEPPSQGVMP